MAPSMTAQEQLVCRPAAITDVLTLFFTNYLVHAVTVLISPGSSAIASADAALWTLLVPYKGIYFALRVIAKRACFTFDPLQRAARAGALCCVYKTGIDAEGNKAFIVGEGCMFFCLETFCHSYTITNTQNVEEANLIHTSPKSSDPHRSTDLPQSRPRLCPRARLPPPRLRPDAHPALGPGGAFLRARQAHEETRRVRVQLDLLQL